MVVKGHVVKLRGPQSRAGYAHLRYLQCDGVSREGEPGRLYSRDLENADGNKPSTPAIPLPPDRRGSMLPPESAVLDQFGIHVSTNLSTPPRMCTHGIIHGIYSARTPNTLMYGVISTRIQWSGSETCLTARCSLFGPSAHRLCGHSITRRISVPGRAAPRTPDESRSKTSS